MLRILFGLLLVAQGLAHALAGMRASAGATGWLNPDPAAGSLLLTSVLTLLWALAVPGFVAAGFGALGIQPFHRAWRMLAGAAATASLLLLGIFRPPMAVAGAVVNVLILTVLWSSRRRVGGAPPVGRLRPSGKARLASAAAIACVAFLALLVLLRPWHMRWGTTDAELHAMLPGDDLDPEPVTYAVQHAVTIHAPADKIWPWLAQLGQDRGGFYSYARLENAFGLGIHHAERIHPEWQGRVVGDTVFATPVRWLGLERRLGWRVAAAEPGRVLVLENWGAFVLVPLDARTTRTIVRTRGSEPGNRRRARAARADPVCAGALHHAAQDAPGDQALGGDPRAAVATEDYSLRPAERGGMRRPI